MNRTTGPAKAGRAITISSIGLVLATALAAAQQPPSPQESTTPPTPEVTFKVEVNYVEEDVRVVDREGRFVRGLKREDFQVVEDGKPQKVETFGMVDIPNTRPRTPLYLGPDALPIEPDVAVNKQVLDGRLYLLVLDDYHVAPLRSQNVRNIARRFVREKLGPDDQAAVVVTSGLRRASQDFTQNRRLLIEAIDNFLGQKLPSAGVERNEKMSREMNAAGAPIDDAGDPIQIDPANRYIADDRVAERTFQARQALNSLRSISEWMSAIQGRRKAIIYISEGVDYNLFDIFTGGDPTNFNFENFNMIQTETYDTIAAASRSNVQIYAVDPRGPDLDGSGRHRDRRAGGGRVQPRAQAAPAGAAVVADEPAPAFGGNGRRRVCRPQRFQRGLRSHRRGEQPVLRARLLLDQRQARRQAAQHRRARRGIPGRAGHLPQAVCGAARPWPQEHRGGQAARPDEEPECRSRQHDDVAVAEDRRSSFASAPLPRRARARPPTWKCSSTRSAETSRSPTRTARSSTSCRCRWASSTRKGSRSSPSVPTWI